MTTQAGVYFEVKAALEAAGITTLDGPAGALPRGPEGLVANCVVLYPSAGVPQVTRMSGGSSGRDDGVTVLCVGHGPLDAASVAYAVQSALDGYRLPSGGLMAPGFVGGQPAVEPNADPQRASMPLEYRTITKG